MNHSEDASRWKSHRHGSQPWGGESGIALVIVLWVLTLITVIAGQFAFTIRQEMDAVRRYKESAEAYYIAQAGLVEALIALVRENALEPGTGLEEEEEDEEDPDAEEAPSWRLNIPVGPVAFASGRFRVTIENDSGRIDLNTADARLLRFAVGAAVPEEDRVEEIVDGILDWRDTDEFHRLNGAESDYYQSLDVPYRSRNGPFETVDELLYVKGVTPELFFGGLEEVFTLQTGSSLGGRPRPATVRRRVSGGGTGINPNAAPPLLLKALPEMTDELVEALMHSRQERDLQTYEEIGDIVGVDVLSAISPYIGFELSPYYTIRSEGMVNHSSVRQRIALKIRMDPMVPDGYEVIGRIEG